MHKAVDQFYFFNSVSLDLAENSMYGMQSVIHNRKKALNLWSTAWL